jgi:transposase
MKAYSVDLRERVADAVLLGGLTWPTVAGLFRLSIASVGRFVRARRTGQPLTPRHPPGGGPGGWTAPKSWRRCGPNCGPNPT